MLSSPLAAERQPGRIDSSRGLAAPRLRAALFPCHAAAAAQELRDARPGAGVRDRADRDRQARRRRRRAVRLEAGLALGEGRRADRGYALL